MGLDPLIGTGAALVIAAVARLWQTAIELLVAWFGWIGMNKAGVAIADEQARDLR